VNAAEARPVEYKLLEQCRSLGSRGTASPMMRRLGLLMGSVWFKLWRRWRCRGGAGRIRKTVVTTMRA